MLNILHPESYSRVNYGLFTRKYISLCKNHPNLRYRDLNYNISKESHHRRNDLLESHISGLASSLLPGIDPVKFELITVFDFSTYKFSLNLYFNGINQMLYDKTLTWTRMPSYCYVPLFVNGRTILEDTACGEHKGTRINDIFELRSNEWIAEIECLTCGYTVLAPCRKRDNTLANWHIHNYMETKEI